MYLFKTRKTRLVQLTITINIHDNTKLIKIQWIKKKNLMGEKGVEGWGVVWSSLKLSANLLNSVLSTENDVW